MPTVAASSAWLSPACSRALRRRSPSVHSGISPSPSLMLMALHLVVLHGLSAQIAAGLVTVRLFLAAGGAVLEECLPVELALHCGATGIVGVLLAHGVQRRPDVGTPSMPNRGMALTKCLQKSSVAPVADVGRMTANDVAARMGVSSRTVRRWAAEGRLAPDDKFPGPTGGSLFHPAVVDLLPRQLGQETAAL